MNVVKLSLLLLALSATGCANGGAALARAWGYHYVPLSGGPSVAAPIHPCGHVERNDDPFLAETPTSSASAAR